MVVYLTVVGFLMVVVALVEISRRSSAERLGAAAVGALILLSQLSETLWAEGFVTTASRLMVAGFVISCAILSLSSSGGVGAGAGMPVVFLVALSLYVASVNVILAPQAEAAVVFGRVAPFLVWCSVAVLVRRGAVSLETFAVVVFAVLGVLSVSSIFVANPWVACTQFKCSDFGSLFVGPFRSENALARLACLAAVLSVSVPRKSIVLMAGSVAVPILIATESRTSQLAFAIAICAGAVAALLRARSMSILRGCTAAYGFLTVAFGVALVQTADASTFSNRGYIWTLGRNAIGSQWIFGAGLDNWSSNVLARNYMHSQSLYLLYAGGLVALLIFALLLASIGIGISKRYATPSIAAVVLVATLGLLEVIANVAAIDGTTPYVLTLLVIGAAGSGRRENPSSVNTAPHSSVGGR